MEILKTIFEDSFIIEPKIYKDNRGFFYESFNSQLYSKSGILSEFIQDNHSLSLEAGVIRGMHYQLAPYDQAKLIRVIKGAIYDVIIDIRKDSLTYGKWQGFILSEENMRQLYVPKGFAHGYCTLVGNTEVIYKVDNYYSAEDDRGIAWNDPALNIDWPTNNPILSDKDTKHPNLEDADNNFTFSK